MELLFTRQGVKIAITEGRGHWIGRLKNHFLSDYIIRNSRANSQLPKTEFVLSFSFLVIVRPVIWDHFKVGIR